MNNTDKEYFRLLNIILEKGKLKKNRTGIDTIGVFGEQAKFDIDLNAFPILTTKKVWFKGILHELLWFIKGDTNIKYLVDNDVHIWDEWAYARYKKSGVYTDEECWNQSGQGIEFYDQKTFVDRIKTDTNFALKWGELGEGTYGGMWRAFPYYHETERVGKGWFSDDGVEGFSYKKFGNVDQLQKVVDKLKSNPDDRRLIVSTWHPYWVDHCALPPCHVMFHFNTEELTVDERWKLNPKMIAISRDKEKMEFCDKIGIPKRKLNCLLYQRSCDTFLGVPFNITSYCLLTALIAHCVDMIPGTFTHTYGDLHIYTNHLEQVKLQLSREPKNLPKLWINPEKKNLFDIKYEDVKLESYESHSSIKAEVAV